MLQKYNMFNVAGLFFDNPNKEFYLKEISKLSGIAHTSIKKYLNDLIKLGIVIDRNEKKGKRKFPYYKANKSSNEYIKYKKVYNHHKIHESGIIEYLKSELMPKVIILFGSYLRGENDLESDIDIYVQSKKTDIQLNRFERKLGHNVQLHFNEDFKNYPKELKNNIINGLVLYGYLNIYGE